LHTPHVLSPRLLLKNPIEGEDQKGRLLAFSSNGFWGGKESGGKERGGEEYAIKILP
jgi:hypothetical protein